MGFFKKIKKGVSKAGRVVKKGASRVGRVAKKGASATGRAARATGRAARKGARATGRAARRAGRATKRGAIRVGRSAKRAGVKAGKGAASVGEGAFSVAKEVANRAAGLPEAGLNGLGILPTKKLRLRVIVLADAAGQPVLAPQNGRSTEDRVMEAIDVAKSIFRKEAKVKIVAADGKLVQIDTKPAPKEALTVHCDGEALKEDLGKAGFFFRKRMARNAVGTVIGAGSPITTFIVDDVVGKAGCSLGPLTDYVTVDVDGITRGTKRTLAHELGHALGLPHTGGIKSTISGNGAKNLMKSPGAGEKLIKRQVVVIRNSRHVTFL